MIKNKADRPFYQYKALSADAKKLDKVLYSYVRTALVGSAKSLVAGANKERYTTYMLMLHKHAKLSQPNAKSQAILDMLSVTFDGNPQSFARDINKRAFALMKADVGPVDIILTGFKEADNLPTSLKYQIAADIEKDCVDTTNIMDKLHEYSAVLLGASGSIGDTSVNITQPEQIRSFRPRTPQNPQNNTPFNPNNQTIAKVCPRCERPNMCVVGGCFYNSKIDGTSIPKESKSALGRDLGRAYYQHKARSQPTRDANVVSPAPAEDADCNIAASPKPDKDSVVMDELAAFLLKELINLLSLILF